MKILFSGGGTLGSVTPLLAVKEVIQEQAPQVKFFWLGTKAGPEKVLVEQANIDFESIPSGKWRRYFSLKNLIDLCKIGAGLVVSINKIRQFKPDVVVMAGGFVAVPVGWAAYILGVPLIVHQQDLTLSLSNKLLTRFASVITCNFVECQKFFEIHKTKIVGNPVRKFILAPYHKGELRLKYNLDDQLPIILIVGGGTGADFLNTISKGIQQILKDQVQIINVVGARGTTFQSRNYLAVKFSTVEMADFLHLADIVISRAGLGFITELAALGKPSIIIPILDSHQEANARYLEEKQAAIIFNQRTINDSTLASFIQNLLRDKAKLLGLSENIRMLYDKDSANKLADIIITQAQAHESSSS